MRPPSFRLMNSGRSGPSGGKATNPRADPDRLTCWFATRQAVPTLLFYSFAPLRSHGSSGIQTEPQPLKDSFRQVRFLAASVGQPVALSAAEISPSRRRVQLANSSPTGHVAEDERAREPPPLPAELSRCGLKRDRHPHCGDRDACRVRTSKPNLMKNL